MGGNREGTRDTMGNAGLTFVIVIVEELVCCDHVKQLEDPTEVGILGNRASKHGHGVDAHLNARDLGNANAGLLYLESLVAELHVIETVYGNVRGGRVNIFTECNPLS